ncbi:MAG TPA: phage tail protein [Vicinamibacterales bacterium]|nr:phage tail protein [Vicinamibacterales bacterium]
MPVGTRKEPFRLYHFLVEIDGITRAGFRECSGLDSTQDAIEYREGNEGLSSRKLPGMVKYSDITLKRGLTDDAQLWEWRKKAMDGKVELKNGSIVLLDETGAEKLRWNFLNGWPTKWTGPSFNASGNEVAIETLEIAHEGVTKA